MTSPYLSSDTELEALCERALGAGRIGLDTEFHRERRYYPELALLQAAVGDELALIDPLTGIDLGPIADLIADAGVVKVLHAPAQDLEIFFHRFGVVAKNVFDTQTAAAMLGLGAQVSLANLVANLLGVNLHKGETFSNWLRRPLSDEQERYALDDVRHLLPLHDRLCAEVDRLGRLDWVRDECAKFEDAGAFRDDDALLYRRVKRYRTLNRRALAVLRELSVWREQTARARDRIRKSVLADEVMLEIARQKPASSKALGRIRGLHAQAVERDGAAILGAVRTGLAVPEAELPVESARQQRDPAVELLAGMVHAILRVCCREAAIDISMIGTVAQVESLVEKYLEAHSPPLSSPLLKGWRGELVGEQIIGFLRGEVCLTVDPRRVEPRLLPVSGAT